MQISGKKTTQRRYLTEIVRTFPKAKQFECKNTLKVVDLKLSRHVFIDYKTFKQATGTMIPLVYVGSIEIKSASRIEWRKLKEKPTHRRMIFYRCTLFRLAKPAFISCLYRSLKNLFSCGEFSTKWTLVTTFSKIHSHDRNVSLPLKCLGETRGLHLALPWQMILFRLWGIRMIWGHKSVFGFSQKKRLCLSGNPTKRYA